MVWLVSVVGAVCVVTSCGTSYWQDAEGGLHYGLWKYCEKSGCSDVKGAWVYWDNDNYQISKLIAFYVLG